MDNRYFTAEDNQTLIYFQLPKVLMIADKYAKMSNDSKLLYMYYLDLNKLSMSNNWKDKEGRYYIKFSDEKAMLFIRCAKQKMAQLKKELRTFGLITTKKTGQGYVDITYVLKLEYTDEDIIKVKEAFEDVAEDSNEKDRKVEVRKSNSSTESNEVWKSNPEKYENQTPRSMKIKPLEVRKSNSINKNNFNDNDFNDNNSINNNSSSSALNTTERQEPNNEQISKQEEEEVNVNVERNLMKLGVMLADTKIMINNKQINETLQLMAKRGIVDFESEDIFNSIEHYRNECTKRSIGQPPVFFVNGFEFKMNQRYTAELGHAHLQQLEIKQKEASKNTFKVPFYNWLEERD